jgi:hypothetical protein
MVKKRKSANKGAPKRKKGASKKKSAMSAVERRALQGVLASGEFRADTSWPRKEDVQGYDQTAFDIPGHFEAVARHFRIWPWYRGDDARPLQCLRGEVQNAPVYYKDADGNTRVAQRHNGYYSVCGP